MDTHDFDKTTRHSLNRRDTIGGINRVLFILFSIRSIAGQTNTGYRGTIHSLTTTGTYMLQLKWHTIIQIPRCVGSYMRDSNNTVHFI